MYPWFQKLKNLPNTHKGTASGLCDSVCILLVFLALMICKACKLQIDLFWYIGGVAIAKIVGSYLFHTWYEAAKKLNEK